MVAAVGGASTPPGVANLLTEAGIAEAPAARVGVYGGNVWDPADGREMPWIDVARQLAGNKGVVALGAVAQTTPPVIGMSQVEHMRHSASMDSSSTHT